MSFQVAFVFTESANEYTACLAKMSRGDWIEPTNWRARPERPIQSRPTLARLTAATRAPARQSVKRTKPGSL